MNLFTDVRLLHALLQEAYQFFRFSQTFNGKRCILIPVIKQGGERVAFCPGGRVALSPGGRVVLSPPPQAEHWQLHCCVFPCDYLWCATYKIHVPFTAVLDLRGGALKRQIFQKVQHHNNMPFRIKHECNHSYTLNNESHSHHPSFPLLLQSYLMAALPPV